LEKTGVTRFDGLEEITVTARRVEENQQKIPVAVTTLTAAALENRNVSSVNDIQFNVPNLQIRPSTIYPTQPELFTAVRQGCGLSVLPDYLVAKDIAAGHLIHVLPQWQLPSGGIHAVYPAVRFRPPKVSAFVEMLTESFDQ